MGAQYSSALIEPEVLLQEIESNAPIKVVDGTFVMPGSPDSPFENFQRSRIGRAVYFDIDEISDKTSSLPHMLPSPEQFEAAVARLGISTDDEIVVYGQSGLVMGPCRVWWTFRAFGHDNIRVLNGGLPYWKARGLPLNSHLPETPAPGRFKARFRPELVKRREDVEALCTGRSAVIADARAAERFEGRAQEPRAGLRSGHIPGSVNVPCGSLVDPQTMRLKSREEIKAIMSKAGVDLTRPIVTSCGSGVTACVIALALFELGYPAASVYDGSWAEWGQECLPTPVSVAA